MFLLIQEEEALHGDDEAKAAFIDSWNNVDDDDIKLLVFFALRTCDVVRLPKTHKCAGFFIPLCFVCLERYRFLGCLLSGCTALNYQQFG